MSSTTLDMMFLGGQWRIGTPSIHDRVMWPSAARIRHLWKEFAGKGELTFLGDTPNPSNHRLVQLPKGTTPKQRAPFIEALARECEPAEESV